MLRFRLHILANSSKAQCYVTMKLGTMAGGKTIICERSKEREKATVVQGYIIKSLIKFKAALQMFPTMEIRLGLHFTLFIIARSSYPTCTNFSLVNKTKSSFLSLIYRILSFRGNTNDPLMKLQ
jgi:hypothetical protein